MARTAPDQTSTAPDLTPFAPARPPACTGSRASRTGQSQDRHNQTVVAAGLILSPAAWGYGRQGIWKKAAYSLSTDLIFPDEANGPGTRCGQVSTWR